MRGVILAGGNGTRIGETAEIYNKHVSQCFDKPVIAYPLKTIAAMGCDQAVIVGSPKSIGDIARYVKDGERFGIDVAYKVQAEPTGVAGAIERAKDLVSGVFPLILGDCYYDPALPVQTSPTLFWHNYNWANQHSVWNPEANVIVEKPRYVDLGKRAIIGYYYDTTVFDFIEGMSPSQSGELEIVDIHNYYRNSGADFVEFDGYFSDMGTPEGLLRAAQHEKERQCQVRTA